MTNFTCLEVFGNIFFNCRIIGSRTYQSLVSKYNVLITIISAQIELKLQWMFLQLSVLGQHNSLLFPVSVGNIKPCVWWNNNVKSSEQSLSHPSLGWRYVFSSFPLPPPPPQLLLLLTSKPFELDLRYLGQRKYRSGKMHWVTFGWPWPKVTAVTLIKICLSAG